MADAVAQRPHIFGVNWFRRDADHKYLWPGFGQNMRVLKWIVERCQGRACAYETPLGWMPRYDDIEWAGLEHMTRQRFQELMTVDRELWRDELELHDQLLNLLAEKLPRQVALNRAMLEQNISI
jgi:phosphoenolpyruvate carboxykinase (GTP)